MSDTGSLIGIPNFLCGDTSVETKLYVKLSVAPFPQDACQRKSFDTKWTGEKSNCRHQDFQSCAVSKSSRMRNKNDLTDQGLRCRHARKPVPKHGFFWSPGFLALVPQEIFAVWLTLCVCLAAYNIAGSSFPNSFSWNLRP